jgi:hypothetical protein
MKSATSLLIVGVALLSVTGCSGTGPIVIDSIQGIVQDNTGKPVPNQVVKFDNSSQFSAITSTNGQYALQIPASSVTGHDKLWIYDQNGNAVLVQPVTPVVSGTGTHYITTSILPH